MDYKIVADSCCDMTPELREKLGVVNVPMIMTLEDKHFIDSEDLDLSVFMREMKECKTGAKSAAPSPDLYRKEFDGTHESFAITVSSKLSGSYSSAVLGADISSNKENVHVFDSKSASAGEILIAVKIRDMINSGLKRVNIIENVEAFISKMKTYFILQNLDNLMKNGRLNKIIGKLVTALNIKPLLGDDGNGNITLSSYSRGQNQALEKLASTIEKSGKKTDGETKVITHCNNESFAERLLNEIKRRYSFKEILVVPTRGLSSMYADDKGIVIAF